MNKKLLKMIHLNSDKIDVIVEHHQDLKDKHIKLIEAYREAITKQYAIETLLVDKGIIEETEIEERFKTFLEYQKNMT